MNAVLCLALLAAVAVIGSRGEPCSGSDTSACRHEHCSFFGATYHVACSKDVCTCKVSGTGYTTAADCAAHCHHGLHDHHTHNWHCVDGNCHCWL